MKLTEGGKVVAYSGLAYSGADKVRTIYECVCHVVWIRLLEVWSIGMLVFSVNFHLSFLPLAFSRLPFLSSRHPQHVQTVSISHRCSQRPYSLLASMLH